MTRPARFLASATDLYAARELIEGLKITHGAAALADALSVLQKWIEEGQDETSELYLFSDFQKTTVLRKGAGGTDPITGLRQLCGAAPLFLVDVGGERPFNYFFTDLTPEDPLLVARQTVRFRATVHALGTPTAPEPRARVTFLVNQVQQGVREVPLSSGSATVEFEHRFPTAGEYEMEVVVEGDTHRLDNHRYYLASVPESLKVLILAEPIASTSEAAYLAAAISPRERPGLDAFSIFSSKIIAPAGLLREDLSSYAGVIILGMPRVAADVATRLESYVREGGSAVFFLSSQSNPFEYNEGFFKEGKGLLPAALGKIEEAEKSRAGGLLTDPARRGAVHPALAFHTAEKLFGDTDILRFMALAPAVRSIQEKVIATFSDGQPALLESKFGRGQVMMFCTAAGPPDNFLPASPAYPMLLQEILRYLAGNPDRAVNLQIGQAYRQDVRITTQHLVLRKPDGSKTRLTPVSAGAGQLPVVVFDQTEQMGRYVLDAPADVVKRPRFVVNLDPTESDLDRLQETEAGQMLPEATWVRSRAVIEEVVRNPSAQMELAGPLLWGLVILLAVEMLLAVRFGMRRH
jgi:hypothetical protein